MCLYNAAGVIVNVKWLLLFFKRLLFSITTANDKNLITIEKLRELKRTLIYFVIEHCAFKHSLWHWRYNCANSFLRENNLCRFNHFNDENCFIPNEI